jgi:hypothetical protein
MQVGGRVRESPETGDPVRATKTVCWTIRISLNYRGHGDSLKNYQYNRSHFHQMARMKKRVHKANEDESQSSTKKAVAPVAVATPVEEALMASEERRSTLHMPFMSSKCWKEDHSGDFAPTL